MKNSPHRVATFLAGLLLLTLLAVGALQQEDRAFFQEPLRGHLDLSASDFQADGATAVKGWAYHPTGIRSAHLIIDERRRLPLQLGMERQDVAAALPGRPGIKHSGLQGQYEFGAAAHGSHEFALEVVLRDGRVMRLGPWRLDLGARAWVLPDQTRAPATEPFHLSIASSHIAKGGIDGIQEKFGRYQSDSMRLAITVPILYMRTTSGRAGDWQFDPRFDISLKCGERTLAEDNLDTVITNAVQKQQPTLFTLNGGVWSDAACDVPEWDINDELEKNKAHVQWNERGEAVPDDYLSHLPGSVHAPELARILSYNVYNKPARTYKKRNLQSAARLIAALNKQHPDLVVGINLDADTYINPFFEGKQWYDYNPDTIRQFREWLQGTGPYAADWRSEDVPNLSTYKRRKNYSLKEVSNLAGTQLTHWEEVDPPRRLMFPTRFFDNPWFAVWDEFRRHLIDLHYDELSQWVHEAGIPTQKIYSSQGFQAPGELIDPFPIHVDSPPKNYDAGGMSVEGSVPSHGRLGAILYGESAQNNIRTENRQPLFDIFNSLSSGWGVVEFHPADLKLPKRVPSFAESYAALNRILTGGAQFVSVMSWNGGSGRFRDQPGYVAFTVIKDSPLESAITALMSNYGGLPKGSIAWAFGSIGVASDDGWNTTEGVGNSAYGRYHMRLGAAGRGIMVHEPSGAEPGLHNPRAVAMEIRSDQDVRIALSGPGATPESAATVSKGTSSQTIVLPIGDHGAAPGHLAIEATGPAGASVFIDRMALLP